METLVPRRRFLLTESTPLVLTYRLPETPQAFYRNSGEPTEILTDRDITVLMALNFCYPQLTMCVTFGAKSVATYQFQCRSPFTVGRWSYLRETTNDDERQRSLAEYNDLITGRRIEGAVSALEQIFTENEMLALHRVHFEMLYSNPLEQVRPMPQVVVSNATTWPNESTNTAIAVDVPLNLTQPSSSNGFTRLGSPIAAGPISSVFPAPMGTTQGNRNSGFPFTVGPIPNSDVGVNFLDNYTQPVGEIDESMVFWDNIADIDTGGQHGNAEAWPLIRNNMIDLTSDDGGDSSSTGSSGKICLMADFEIEHRVTILPGPQINPTRLEGPTVNDNVIPPTPTQGTPVPISTPTTCLDTCDVPLT